MHKIYNTAFQFGVVFNIFLFTILNIVSFMVARNKYESIDRSIMFSPDYGFSWGFPFIWDETYFKVVEGAGTILNVIIWVSCSFAFGFLFKFIRSKVSSRRVELK